MKKISIVLLMVLVAGFAFASFTIIVYISARYYQTNAT